MIERNADILCMSVSQLEKQLLKVYTVMHIIDIIIMEIVMVEVAL